MSPHPPTSLAQNAHFSTTVTVLCDYVIHEGKPKSLHLDCIVSKCVDLCFGRWEESERYCIQVNYCQNTYKQFFCCSLVRRSLHLDCIVSKCINLCFGHWEESERYCIQVNYCSSPYPLMYSSVTH